MYVTMDEIEEQAISDTKVAAPTGTTSASGTGFSEICKSADAKAEAAMTDHEQDEKPFTETKATPHEKAGLDIVYSEAGETKSLQLQDDSSDKSDDEEGDGNKEEDDSDGNEIISDAEFRRTLEENNEIIKKYVREQMFVGLDWGIAESMDIFLGSEDEGEEVEVGPL
jgi:hypothetical protein